MPAGKTFSVFEFAVGKPGTRLVFTSDAGTANGVIVRPDGTRTSTNGVFNFVDTNTPSLMKFYELLLLP